MTKETALGADNLRPGEIASALPDRQDAHLVFIGRIRTPFPTRAECPRQGQTGGPECRVEVDAQWAVALAGLERFQLVEVIYWMHESRRDLVRQSPRCNGETVGTFGLRSPVRPNPIATSVCKLERIEGATVIVRGLDCLDGTPLLDLKPSRAEFQPQASPKPTVTDEPPQTTIKELPWCASTGGG